ncbi:jacalin-like lectin [Leptolyngbya ohadii]|uniref:jacalin-like lectin n=1 Tax=Leptolyngbya ohadii TaxID=1962290 RepID=UPI000B5A0019|nr:jacalin-like lectin [Leptolyngbya ohadii]
MSIVIKSFGGNNPFNRDGGSPFPIQPIKTLGVQTGDAVDALILNGRRYGGRGGRETEQLELGRDEYINKIVVRSDWNIDFLEFQTNKGRTINGGGRGGKKDELENIRVIGLGGRSGDLLDKISVRYISNYQESRLIGTGQLAITNIIPPGETIEESVSTEIARLVSITRIWELVFGQGIGASADIPLEAFKAKVASETNIKATTREEVKTEIRALVRTEQRRIFSPPPGFAGVEIAVVDVYQDGNFVWFFPTTSEVIPVSLEGFDSNFEAYDLTKVLAVQFPSMMARRVTMHSYDFYRAVPLIQLLPVERLKVLYGNSRIFSDVAQ